MQLTEYLNQADFYMEIKRLSEEAKNNFRNSLKFSLYDCRWTASLNLISYLKTCGQDTAFLVDDFERGTLVTVKDFLPLLEKVWTRAGLQLIRDQHEISLTVEQHQSCQKES
jgi:hypothetical protein